MRFFSAILTSASLIGAVLAQSKVVFFTDVPTSVTAGTPVTIKFTAGSGPATITLRKGASTNLQDVEVITTSATGGSFQWTPEKTLSNGADYAFQITQGAEVNYSGPVAVSGGSNTPFTPSGSATAASATATSPTTLTATLKQASSGTPSGTPTTPTTPSASSASTRATTTSSRASAASSTSSAAPSNAAGMNSHSPVALIFGAVVAMAYLN